MALVLKDRVQEVTTTSGTGTLTLSGAVAGFQTFSTAIGNGNTTFYTIFDSTAGVWEVGIGTVGAGTLARTTVLSNSSGTTTPISLAGNSSSVFCTYPAEKSINYDANGVATIGEELNYADTGIVGSFASTVAGYNQVIVQNKSTATNASSNLNVSNDAGTAGSNYAELGINSSTFTGAGSFNIAGASYVASASTDLTLGTYGAYNVHFVTNSNTTDAMTIFDNGGISLGGFLNPGIANMAASKFVPGYTAVTSAAGTTVLTASSNFYQNLTGTTTQTFQLPDATTLLVGTTFIFDNDSTGTLSIVDNASGPIDTIPSGGIDYLYLTNNSTVAGAWRKHAFIPASYDFNNTTASFGNAAITNAVWNGTTIGTAYGGTGLTSFSAANYALYSTNSSTLTAGTLPVAAGGTGLTSLTAGRIPYGDGTNPFGSSANLFWDSANNWLGIGTSSPATKITINNNTALPSAGAITGTGLWQVGADASVNNILLDGFASAVQIVGRRSAGTSASPTAISGGGSLLALQGYGYGATGYSSAQRVSINLMSNEVWSDTAQGTRITFSTTANTTTTTTERMRIDDAGNVGIGTTSPSSFAKLAVTGVTSASNAFQMATTGNTSGLYMTPSDGGQFSLNSYGSGLTINSTTSTGVVTVGTQSTERMRIDSSGNVGIGTTSPAAKLDIGSGNLNFSSTGQRITGDFSNATIANRLMFQNSVVNANTNFPIIPNGTATQVGINLYNNSDPTNASSFNIISSSSENSIRAAISGTGTYLPITFYTNAAERMRIDTSGNVGIGTTSPTNRLNIYSATSSVVAVDGDLATAFQGTRYSSDNTSPVFIGRKARGTLASPSAVATGDLVNTIQGWAYGGSNFRTIAAQRYVVETYTADDNISGYLSFLTRPTGVAASLSERMRIDSSGNVGIGCTPGASLTPRLEIASTFSAATASTPYNGLLVESTDAQAADKGGVISLGGLYDASSGVTRFAAIAGLKENGTSGNYAGYLAFYSRVNGSVPAERMRIDSSGNVLIGTSTSPAGSKELVLGGDYIEGVVANGTVGASATLSLANGTVQTATLTSATACTFTMPTNVAGKSFILLLKQPASGTATTATFTNVKWPAAGAPTITATVGKMDILTFVADGTNWYGSYAQGYTP